MKKNTTVKISRKSARWACVGIDLGDRSSRACVLDPKKQILTEFQLPTTPDGFRARFQSRRPTLIVVEAGTHSHWSSHLLEALGHTVIVANPRQLQLISHSHKKTDRTDAITLARLGLSDLALLSPVQPRSPQQQMHLTALRARAELIALRTALLTSARSLVKPHGLRLASGDASTPQAHLAASLPPELKDAIGPLLEQVDNLTQAIHGYDRQLAALAASHYPETDKLRKIRGVGLIVSLTFVLVLADPRRFRRSRQVGAYTGTTPRRNDSGQRSPQLGITKHGDAYLRAMLTQSAQFILGPLGEDCDLRRWGLRICERGGKNAKKRAVTAVARKLAVLMHRLWISDEPYDRFHNARHTQPAAA
jgi:transposase